MVKQFNVTRNANFKRISAYKINDRGCKTERIYKLYWCKFVCVCINCESKNYPCTGWMLQGQVDRSMLFTYTSVYNGIGMFVNKQLNNLTSKTV